MAVAFRVAHDDGAAFITRNWSLRSWNNLRISFRETGTAVHIIFRENFVVPGHWFFPKFSSRHKPHTTWFSGYTSCPECDSKTDFWPEAITPAHYKLRYRGLLLSAVQALFTNAFCNCVHVVNDLHPWRRMPRANFHLILLLTAFDRRDFLSCLGHA